MSDETASIVDEEVKLIVDRGYKRATEILEKHKDELETLAKALLEYETLNGEEIKQVLRGEVIIREFDDDDGDLKPQSSVPSSGDLGEDLGGGEVPQGA